MTGHKKGGVTLHIQPPGWGTLFMILGLFMALTWLSPCFQGNEPSFTETNTPKMAEPPTRGAPDAPVSMVEFADFYCPFCFRHFQQTLPRIEEEYIQKGLVRYSFYNLIVHGEPARLAAQAGKCAHAQGKFWEFHDRLFVVIFQERKEYLSDEALKEIARGLGLNEESFATCLHSARVAAEVEKDHEKLDELIAQLPEGQQPQGLGTPTFFINGHLLVGAQPFESFKQIIDEELAKLRK